jgi:uncharacterized membrane protein
MKLRYFRLAALLLHNLLVPSFVMAWMHFYTLDVMTLLAGWFLTAFFSVVAVNLYCLTGDINEREENWLIPASLPIIIVQPVVTLIIEHLMR